MYEEVCVDEQLLIVVFDIEITETNCSGLYKMTSVNF